jgi:SNF2-related domain/Helicase conserved C-terminal domain
MLQLRSKALLGGGRLLPLADWPKVSGRPGAAARILLGQTETGSAEVIGNGVLLPHAAVAALPSTLAETLGLPALGTLSITLAFDGIMTDPRARIRASWYDGDDNRVPVERVGALGTWGKLEGRLSPPLFELADAIDTYNGTEGADSGARIAAWAPVQAALQRTTGEEVRTDDRYLRSLTIYQAGAVALDVFQTDYGPDFLPVVMGREKVTATTDDAAAPEGGEDSEGPPPQRDLVADALLPPRLQQHFARSLFAGEARSRDAYALDRNVYLVLDPAIKTALDVIRAKRAAPSAERLAFVRNPRTDIAAALGEDGEAAALAMLVETWQYSDRVLGLGVWEPPPIPWLKTKAGQWLPERFPVRIGGETVELDRQLFQQLQAAVLTACEDGSATLVVNDQEFQVADVKKMFVGLGFDPSGNPPTARDPEPDPELPEGEAADDGKPAGDDYRLVIQQNLDGQEFTVAYDRRPVAIDQAFPQPPLVVTSPKPHQVAGFDWLVAGYRVGWPGMLLADDMGLGKTFQALAFLAWVRKNRITLGVGRGARNRPILIVAPTALLSNWIEEAERHLDPDALGERIDAFGSALRRLKSPRDEHWSRETALDVPRLRAADWILTTYETLADNHRAFARVGCSVIVFDEAQKIKSPGAINTQSAKAMNADFVLGLTGTPIENRLADLWSIMDRLVPGYLGDLKGFVSTYEDGGEDELRRLKAALDTPRDATTPPLLLRRMKAEILEGLPTRTIEPTRVTMPTEQAVAYHRAVQQARLGTGSRGDMLSAIHAFRGIALHPDGAAECDLLDPQSVRKWFARSARLMHAVGVLEGLKARGEKALVFVEDLEVQASFAAAIATHLGLSRPPAIINGGIPGEKRLAIVDGFQSGPPGFDLLVLSPKAAGVGLTITAANHVIHLSRWWNPAVEDQCNDRCYRIGQTKPVTVHVPIAVHPDYGDDSFDVRLDELLERKRRLSRDLLLPPIADSDIDALFAQTTRQGQA